MHVTAAGVEVPALGFGTARMNEYETEYRAVEAALEAGYRHVDTAQIYGSEPAVGDAIADSDLDREEVFVTTKLAGENRAYDAVVESTRESLDDLDTSYVDLLLIHWPVDDVPTEETLRAMNDLRDDGLVSHVGVSNFSVPQLREARELSDAPILTNQVEYHAGHRQDELLAYCIEEGVMLTAYSPLGVGDLLDDETLGAVADRHGKTPAQVAIRWLLQQPTVATVPMSSSPAHVRENFDVFDFELSGGEMRELFAVEGSLDADLADRLGLDGDA
jgi:diketogulonate reductase-like aldo/keto reductase